MRILFTGGGTGGHFFPIIAIAESVNEIVLREHIVGVELLYMSDDPYDQTLLDKEHIKFIPVMAGKRRTYSSSKNFFDVFKTAFGIISALGKIFMLYPDVVFGKGGYASFPALVAARILRIPVVIHESDISPGRVNAWIAPYASKIAISYPETKKYFPKKKESVIALTGIPLREEIRKAEPLPDSHSTFDLDPNVPTILVLGGSLGSENINEHMVDVLPRLLERYQVIHQCGEANYAWMKERSDVVLRDNSYASRYKLQAFLHTPTLIAAYSAADLVVSRGGGTIFEIAIWKKPAILIPLAIARGDHQRENAYSYARTGAAIVIEEQNLKPTLLLSIIERIMEDPEERRRMSSATKEFSRPEASETIAEGLLAIALSHV